MAKKNEIYASMMICLFAVAGLFVLSRPEAAPPATPPTHQADLDAAGFHDLVGDKTFASANPGYLEAIAALIQRGGYECPHITSLLVKGDSPFGAKLEALCGPANGTGNTNTLQHYAVYPDRLKVDLCKQWSTWRGECG